MQERREEKMGRVDVWRRQALQARTPAEKTFSQFSTHQNPTGLTDPGLGEEHSRIHLEPSFPWRQQLSPQWFQVTAFGDHPCRRAELHPSNTITAGKFSWSSPNSSESVRLRASCLTLESLSELPFKL